MVYLLNEIFLDRCNMLGENEVAEALVINNIIT